MRTIIRLGIAAGIALAVTPAWAGDSDACYDEGMRRADCPTVVIQSLPDTTSGNQGNESAGGGSGEPGSSQSEDEFLLHVWIDAGA